MSTSSVTQITSDVSSTVIESPFTTPQSKEKLQELVTCEIQKLERNITLHQTLLQKFHLIDPSETQTSIYEEYQQLLTQVFNITNNEAISKIRRLDQLFKKHEILSNLVKNQIFYITKLQNDIDTLSKDLKQETLAKQVDDLDHQLTCITKQLQEKQQIHDELTQQINTCSQKLRVGQGNKVQIKANKERLSTARSAISAEIDKLDLKKKSLEVQKHQTTIDNILYKKNIQESIQSKSQEITNVKAQVDNLNNEANQVKESFDAFLDECGQSLFSNRDTNRIEQLRSELEAFTGQHF